MRTSGGSSAMHVVRFDELSSSQVDAWHTLRCGNPGLDSPFFHPGFAGAVHRAGTDVHVLLADDSSGRIKAILPCHRNGSILRPAGWPAADFQGPILASGTRFDPRSMLVGRARAYTFDHLVKFGPEFEPWIESDAPSPFMDVSGGLTGYLGRASRSGKDNMGQARRRANKAESRFGPIRFALDSVDDNMLERVIQLKRGQYAATGAKDFFADPRRKVLLHGLLHTRDSSFGGVLSTVHAGPNLLAAHFGLRSGGVLHWWFPVYEPNFSNLAPGWILLRELVSAAPELGITRIDLGRGEDEYKRRAKTDQTTVSQGMVTSGAARRIIRRGRVSTVAFVKESRLAPSMRKAARKVRTMQQRIGHNR